MVRETAYDAYEKSARQISAPMFRRQPGCLGVILPRDSQDARTITFGRDRAAIEVLASSASYRETVDRIMAADLLEGEQPVSVHPIFGGELAPDRLEHALLDLSD